jgi:hypothetical protein
MCAARVLWLTRLDHDRGIHKRALKLATASLCFIPRSGRGISARRVCKSEKKQVRGGGNSPATFHDYLRSSTIARPLPTT